MSGSILKLSLPMALSLAAILSSCSDFIVANSSSANGSLSAPQLAVTSASPSMVINQTQTFAPGGQVFSGSESYSWSHSLVDASSGAALPMCQESAGSQSNRYSLNCSHLGTLTVKLTVIDGAKTYGPAFAVQSVLATAPSPTPTPTATPVPSGPNAAGSQLYATSCAGCHGSLSNNNIGARSVSGVTSAIASVGQMRSISLTASQIQSIVDALNGK